MVCGLSVLYFGEGIWVGDKRIFRVNGVNFLKGWVYWN